MIFTVVITGSALLAQTDLLNITHSVVTVTPHKPTYFLGEIVKVTMKLSRPSFVPVGYKSFTVQNGRTQVFVSFEHEPWLEYIGPGWGIDCTEYMYRLIPKDGDTGEFTLLVNFNPALFANVDPAHGRYDYVFARPGRYRIRAELWLENDKSQSESTEITILEPNGTQRESMSRIWSEMKASKQLGVMMQGGFMADEPKQDPMELLTKVRALRIASKDTPYDEQCEFAERNLAAQLERAQRR
jgi:hypothetical protein